jgi:hypothetical protein
MRPCENFRYFSGICLEKLKKLRVTSVRKAVLEFEPEASRIQIGSVNHFAATFKSCVIRAGNYGMCYLKSNKATIRHCSTK